MASRPGYKWQSARYAKCAENGMTQAETARELGVTRGAVSKFANRNPHIKFSDGIIETDDQPIKYTMADISRLTGLSNKHYRQEGGNDAF